MHEETKEKAVSYLTFDDPQNIMAAREDAKTFLNFNKPPLILDEIQYMPGLFPFIKMRVDSEKQKGMYFLTGSQHS